MTEPDVALTDYALAIECTIFAYQLQRKEHALFFASAAVASLAGGTVHGFFLDARTLGNAVLWRITMIAIGVTAASAWAIGARVLFPGPTARRVSIAAAAALAAYCVVTVFITQEFRAAVVFYLPAVVFLWSRCPSRMPARGSGASWSPWRGSASCSSRPRCNR